MSIMICKPSALFVAQEAARVVEALSHKALEEIQDRLQLCYQKNTASFQQFSPQSLASLSLKVMGNVPICQW